MGINEGDTWNENRIERIEGGGQLWVEGLRDSRMGKQHGGGWYNRGRHKKMIEQKHTVREMKINIV